MVVCAFLVAFAVVPITALPQDRPARWGWQMYSGAKTAPVITVQMRDGSVEHPAMTDLIAHWRHEVDYREPVARLLCRRETDAVTVTLVRESPAFRSSYSCSSF